MRKPGLLMLLTLLVFCGAFAQGVQIPEFKNEPMLINKDSSITKLEKSRNASGMQGNNNHMSQAPTGGSTMYQNGSNTPVMTSGAYLPGTFDDGPNRQLSQIVCADIRSAVRTDTMPQFIVKLADAEDDPEPLFFLTKAKVIKNNRVVYTMKSNYYGQNQVHARIPLEFKKIAPGVYKIIPAALEPGSEYGLVSILDGGKRLLAYMFGTN